MYFTFHHFYFGLTAFQVLKSHTWDSTSLEQGQHQAPLDTYTILRFALQVQFPMKPLNPLSTPTAPSQLTSYSYLQAPSLQALSPGQPSRYYHSRDLPDWTLSKRETLNTEEYKGFITSELPENTMYSSH